MNILYLAHRIPYPPDKGDKMRAFRHVEYLGRRHRLWCACFVDTRTDLVHVAPLRRHCVDVVAVLLDRPRAILRGAMGLLRGGTVTESFYRHQAMSDALCALGRSVRFDTVVAFSSSMAQYALNVPAARHVLDLCDLDSQKWLEYAAISDPPLAWLYGAEGRRLATLEHRWIRDFDTTILISNAEAKTVRLLAPTGKLRIITNGVDLPKNLSHKPLWHRFSTGETPALQTRATLFGIGSKQNESRCIERTGAPTVGFVGVLNYRPNVDAVCWFVEHCWREIRDVYPSARFRVVGRSPTRRIRRLSSAPGVDIVGPVQDVQDELQRFDVSVAPMRTARGLQNKVLEAMAAGLPVVLTAKAAEGIDAIDGREYLIVDPPDRMIRCILQLLREPAKRSGIGQAARRFVASRHRWEDALRPLEFAVTGMIERTTRRATTVSAVDMEHQPAMLQAQRHEALR